MNPGIRSEIHQACRVLFGREPDPRFLDGLGEPILKAAWRMKALETHPDRTCERAFKPGMAERFIEARRAYGLLRSYLERRAPRREQTPRPPHAGPRGAAPYRPHPRQAPPHGTGAARRSGLLPRRRLRLGEYLYHSRVIPFSALIEAIVWQRRQRERFCEIGWRWGYLSEAAVRELLEARHAHELVGTAAQRLRLLTPLQVRTVLRFQRSRQQPIGSYFVRRGLITPADLPLLVRDFDLHNATFSG